MKQLIDIISQVGIPGLIVVATIAFTWRLLPHLIRWLGEQTRQARTVSEAMPRMEQSLHQMATDGNQLLQEANAKLDRLLLQKGT